MLRKKPRQDGAALPDGDPSGTREHPEQPGNTDLKGRPTNTSHRPAHSPLTNPAGGAAPYKSVPPGHGNSPDLLKYYLAQRYASPANLAREANVSRAAVSAVIHGRTRSERIERLIAKSCGKTLHELFPAWYPEEA